MKSKHAIRRLSSRSGLICETFLQWLCAMPKRPPPPVAFWGLCSSMFSMLRGRYRRRTKCRCDLVRGGGHERMTTATPTLIHLLRRS
jgi:hypothetical protein